mmetsp:Transcript_24634/g.30279  ORF Transcript_24634/g.30279 Transcript_24634/m.30279 type:complete len:486 (+) Transcript_24634:26-1483(+)
MSDRSQATMASTASRRPLPLGSATYQERTDPYYSYSSTFMDIPKRQAPSIVYGDNQYDYEGGATFRHAGSTTKALSNLAQKKYEARERQRAISLLSVLFAAALVIHLTTSDYFSQIMPQDLDKTASLNFANGQAGTSKVGRGDSANSKRQTNKGMTNDEAMEKVALGGENAEVGAITLDADQEFWLSLSNISEHTTEDWNATDIPFFWHVPRAGGSTLKAIAGTCLDLVQASETGVTEGHGHDESVQVFEVKGAKYVNVDTTSIGGLARAKQLNLADSGSLDIVFSSYIKESAAVFSESHKGRGFVLLRDPIERAISMFYYLADQPGNPDIADMTVEEYAQSTRIENNWMVRYLSDQMEGEINKSALEKAKEALKRKFVIGLTNEYKESLYRFTKYNKWTLEDEAVQEKQDNCVSHLAEFGIGVNNADKKRPEKGDQSWALITWQNQYDIKLYEYGIELFTEQTKEYGSKESKKQLKKKEKRGGK